MIRPDSDVPLHGLDDGDRGRVDLLADVDADPYNAHDPPLLLANHHL